MPEVPDSLEVLGPRKRKLSTKANTNGDPIEERKQKRLAQGQKTGAPTKRIVQSSAKTMAPAKTPLAKTAVPAKTTASVKTTSPAKTMAPAKISTMFAKVAPMAGPSKPGPRRPSVEIEEVDDESNCQSSVSPRNPRHILEAADGSDDDIEGPPEPIIIDVDDEGMDNVEENPEEDDEAELRRWPYPDQKPIYI
jgi:hypothetical protein